MHWRGHLDLQPPKKRALTRCGGNDWVPAVMHFLCCEPSAALRSAGRSYSRYVRCCRLLRCAGSLRPHLATLHPGARPLSPRLEDDACQSRMDERCMCALGPMQCSWSARRGPSRSTPGPSATAASSRRGPPAAPGPARPQLARLSGPARRAAPAVADTDPCHPAAFLSRHFDRGALGFRRCLLRSDVNLCDDSLGTVSCDHKPQT
jgi:hypothetical protein